MGSDERLLCVAWVGGLIAALRVKSGTTSPSVNSTPTRPECTVRSNPVCELAADHAGGVHHEYRHFSADVWKARQLTAQRSGRPRMHRA
jgi:hypothetical protein